MLEGVYLSLYVSVSLLSVSMCVTDFVGLECVM